ncbi:CxxC-x17-CxxC domain-containing protein [Bryocella elongata]|uniref:CxxC-x17-CxxC domain-containing protein n=1 Tax=Bryocella elongata TaxID=863522 RepID=A0A1H6A9A9_9BACT|nr:zinc-ribbon domain containing protein [Bryocella elongata]SEG44645.1 CxxC-x17-CxxC domain-containing protein [Bryocella elongata]
MQFVDRVLKCADCGNDFVFTAGEQLFFADKQFKNDPKRCKLCKAKRAGLGRSTAAGASTLPLSRTETRTNCSACGIETTVPFKPTQGRPVLCRSCFQLKRVPSAVAAVATMDAPGSMEAQANAALDQALAEQRVDLPVGIPTELIAETKAAQSESEAMPLSAPSATADA